MKTIKQFNISLIIRGLIIPIILLTTLLGGYRLNQKIVSLIDFGFTEKLATLSSTAGAFVRNEDHNLLIQPREVYNIRSGPDERWFVLSSEGDIHELYTDGSVTLEPIMPLIDKTEKLLSFAYFGESLITLSINGSMIKWAPDGAILNQTRVNSRPNSKIATSPSNNLVAFGPDVSGSIQLFFTNLERTTTIEPLPNEILDLSFSPDNKLVVLTDNQELLSIDPSTGSITESVSISCQDSDTCAEIHSLAFINEANFWGLSEALTRLSSDGSIDPEFYAHPNYHDHTADRYLNYVVPMREIREKQELTYLYSLILNDKDKTISYVLDSSIDDDFTHIGYVDSELELDDFIAGTDVLLTTKAYVSNIKPWGQWGLVKIGYAPIYNADGRGAAIMGADQNVSSIDQVSREAFVILSLSSFVFLLFGATASWFIAKSLTSPLLALKDNVLSIAAGFLDRLVVEPSLKDLHPLANVFREAGDNLKKEVVQGPQILQKFETMRLEQDYRSFLEMKFRDDTRLPLTLEIDPVFRQATAWFSSENVTLIWILKGDQKQSDINLKRHNSIFYTISGLIENEPQLDTVILKLHKHFESNIGSIIGFDHATEDFQVYSTIDCIVSVGELSIEPEKITHIKNKDIEVATSDANLILSISKGRTS